MARIAKRVGVELIWFIGACAVGMWFLMTLAAGMEENSTRAVAGQPPLQNWPEIPWEWHFVVLLAPYALSILLRLAFGRSFRTLLEAPLAD